MVKSFKKGMAMVLAAAMVFSTPVALNKTVVKADESSETTTETSDSLVSYEETLTGTEWWNGMQTGKDYALKDGGSLTLDVEFAKGNSDGYGAFSVELTDGKTYITTGSDQNAWGAAADTLTEEEKTAANDVKDVTGVAETPNSTIKEGRTYRIKVSRDGENFAVEYTDTATGKVYASYTAKSENLKAAESVNVHIMAQVGTYNISLPEELTGTEWWTGMQTGKDYLLSGDTATKEFDIDFVEGNSDGYGAFSVELTDGKTYITTGSDQNAWGAAADTLTEEEKTAANDVKDVTGAAETPNSTIKEGHTYRIKVSRNAENFAVEYTDAKTGKVYASYTAKSENLKAATDIKVHVMAQVGTYLVGAPKEILAGEEDALIKDAKAVLSEDGKSIELSYVQELGLDNVSIDLNGEKIATGSDVTVGENEKGKIDVAGNATYTYSIEDEGEYKFTITASKEPTTGDGDDDDAEETRYLDDTETAEITIVKSGDKFYELVDEGLITEDIAVSENDDAFSISWKTADDAKATCVIKDKDGNVKGTLTESGSKVEKKNLTVNTDYTVELVVTKGNQLQKKTTTLSYVAKQEATTTSRWKKITTQPLLFWEFDKADENGLKLFGKAEVKDGVLNLGTEINKIHENYAQLPSLTSKDFSNGMTVTMDVNVKGWNTNDTKDWTKFFVFGNGNIGDTAQKTGDVAYGFTIGFNSVLDVDSWIKTGYYGGGQTVTNGTQVDGAAPLGTTDMPVKWDWYSDSSKQNRWDNITVTVTKDEMVTYYDGVKVQSNKADYSCILDAMKKASNNYLGTSYFSDTDFVGSMDNFAIYNSALSADDVKTLSSDIKADTTPAKTDDTNTSTVSSQKKSLMIKSVSAKAGAKKVSGELNVSGAKVTVKVGSKAYKAAKVSGKKFTFTASSKLKIGTKVTVKATKDGYSTATKSITVKGTMKLSGVKAKKNSTKITGKVSVKKATVKVKVGSKKYKKATVKGKKFTFKTSKLKKGTKVKIKVTKKNYKTVTKTVKVK